MKKISCCLWFDSNAEEAVEWYISLFKNSKMGDLARYDEASSKASGRPVGSVMTVSFQVEGLSMLALNGGPYFKINPSLSFLISCESKEEVDELWRKLSDGGKILMELGKYPFSEWYGWTEDKYGVSWQVMLTQKDQKMQQKITPMLLFVGGVCGKAEEAMKLYTSIFKNSAIEHTHRYPAGSKPDKEGTIAFANFMLEGQVFAAMDSAHEHKFAFNEGISLIVNCENQEEIDAFWEKLTSQGGQEVQCGWLKDRYGVSWQIVPSIMDELMKGPRSKEVMRAMLGMKKLDIEKLKNA